MPDRLFIVTSLRGAEEDVQALLELIDEAAGEPGTVPWMNDRYSDLSKMFPWRAKVREHELPHLLELLSRSDDNTSDGSSFAVTTGPGLMFSERYLWLSDLSEERLRWAALSPGTGAVSSQQ